MPKNPNVFPSCQAPTEKGDAEAVLTTRLTKHIYPEHYYSAQTGHRTLHALLVEPATSTITSPVCIPVPLGGSDREIGSAKRPESYTAPLRPKQGGMAGGQLRTLQAGQPGRKTRTA